MRSELCQKCGKRPGEALGDTQQKTGYVLRLFRGRYLCTLCYVEEATVAAQMVWLDSIVNGDARER